MYFKIHGGVYIKTNISFGLFVCLFFFRVFIVYSLTSFDNGYWNLVGLLGVLGKKDMNSGLWLAGNVGRTGNECLVYSRLLLYIKYIQCCQNILKRSFNFAKISLIFFEHHMVVLFFTYVCYRLEISWIKLIF